MLLLSAKLSLQAQAAEPACIDSLTRCIGGIRQRYDLAGHDLQEGPTWRGANIDGILCLLDYVEAEVRERLHDSGAADELRQCAQLLAASRQLCRRRRTVLQPLVRTGVAYSAPKTALS